MGILDFIFGKKTTKQKGLCEPEQNQAENTQAPQQYMDMASQNADVVEGMEFIATCQLRTPIAILKKHGEVYVGEGMPPAYGTPQDGVWVPKLNSSFDFLDEGNTTASDAGQVNAGEYIDYAVGLLSIFESDISITDKMDKALAYSGNNGSKKQIERKILAYYCEKNIADVMARFVSESERIEFYFDKANRLTLVSGVNKKAASALEASGIYTIKELSNMTESDLVKINGIGKVSAQKIISHLSS
ncbi:hypothetical protein F9L16_01670 [Agarivorans sp. B2Z047]|uniref:helix-hairpin-helix domain-containing protein n=1 Tax=Agarivorans sp. B2Z047 TaxID=2652721 RepID=UPI00128B5B33|nr:helix-hairpin-helix domain-containing protein [Agarivorans sp. B2Z047]MPW27709.1 hypothetical protein [Agarivorans sp. B2Z047]UQN44452.1 helix-hairpin-helix domain-containing protein [Agarivorans sp. B2Z047]